MKAKFAQISYKEISETRKKALQDYTHDMVSWRSLKELSLHCLKRFPFLVIWVAILDIYLKYCNRIVINRLSTLLGIGNTYGKIPVMVVTLALLAIFSYKIIFSTARYMFPRKTPINDMVSRMQKFHDETEYLEDVTRVMDKLQKLSTEDLAYTELIIDENSIVLMIKNSEVGYIEKNKYAVKNEEVLKILKETGVLDFSSVDVDWKILKEKYQIA